MIVSEIVWETDGTEVDDLPDTVLIPDWPINSEEDVAEFLSRKFGWLISSYVIDAE